MEKLTTSFANHHIFLGTREYKVHVITNNPPIGPGGSSPYNNCTLTENKRWCISPCRMISIVYSATGIQEMFKRGRKGTMETVSGGGNRLKSKSIGEGVGGNKYTTSDNLI